MISGCEGREYIRACDSRLIAGIIYSVAASKDTMVVPETENTSGWKQDLIHLAVLLSIALVIGVYLIVTTVLIAKDGALYIQLARKLSTNPNEVITNSIPFGYPLLIFVAHKLVTLFCQSQSVYNWIYAAQGITLLCRLLALIPLYFIGKLLVGSRKSFWALLVLIVLPYPARSGSDALRDWPHLVFFATGLLAIVWAIDRHKWWLFGLAGLACGLGYLIRPISLQLVICGAIWLGYRFFRPAGIIRQRQALFALALMIAGFLIPAAPHAKASGKLLPAKIRGLLRKVAPVDKPATSIDRIDRHKANNPNYSASAPGTLLCGIGKVCKAIGENMMWLFAVSSLAGLIKYFRSRLPDKYKLLIAIFITFNLVVLWLRCTNFDNAMSKRYLLPLSAVIVFYSVTGLEILSGMFAKKHCGDNFSRQQKLRFYILLTAGVLICLPKLTRPMRIDKQGYLRTAEWLRNNTTPDDRIAVPDRRIALYAERKAILSKNNKVPPNAAYIVRISTNGTDEPVAQSKSSRVFWAWSDPHKKKKKLEVYEVM